MIILALAAAVWLLVVELPAALTHDRRHAGRPCTIPDILDRIGADQ